MDKKVEIAFGRRQLEVALPEGAQPTMIRKTSLPKLADQQLAVRQALDHPVEAKPLRTLAAGRQSACILICDITRPVPNKLFLRPMIEDLIAAGVPAEKISVLVATGLHRPNEGAELEELVGDPWVLKTVRVENHFARSDADHADLGRTSRGTPVCALPPGWSSRISWPAGRERARSWLPAWPIMKPFGPSIRRDSWRIRWPFNATWPATRFMKSSSKSFA
jgi:nickel-dependent lactate racemase